MVRTGAMSLEDLSHMVSMREVYEEFTAEMAAHTEWAVRYEDPGTTAMPRRFLVVVGDEGAARDLVTRNVPPLTATVLRRVSTGWEEA